MRTHLRLQRAWSALLLAIALLVAPALGAFGASCAELGGLGSSCCCLGSPDSERAPGEVEVGSTCCELPAEDPDPHPEPHEPGNGCDCELRETPGSSPVEPGARAPGAQLAARWREPRTARALRPVAPVRRPPSLARAGPPRWLAHRELRL